nr:hypothetical protein [Tanacetum cinerariifolium]
MEKYEVGDTCLEEYEFENTCNNDKNLSEIQLENEKEDELVVMVVKVAHKLGCKMVVKEIKDELLEEMEKFGWWFEQDIDGESGDEKNLVMVIEEGEFKKDDHQIVVERKKSTISRLPLDVYSPSFGIPRDRSYENCLLQNKFR